MGIEISLNWNSKIKNLFLFSTKKGVILENLRKYLENLENSFKIRYLN